jgi:nitrate reductase assembly molybdenum cofactor insertion protein NarJ
MKTMSELESMDDEELKAYETEVWKSWKQVTVLLEYRKHKEQEEE